MISIPIAVNIPKFKWQTSLWWWNHKKTYGDLAEKKACLIILDKNFANDIPLDTDWYKSIPHVETTGVWNNLVPNIEPFFSLPLNIQIGLKSCLDKFNDDDILELNDCDLFHFKPHVDFEVNENHLYVCDIYENWHLLSKSKNKFVIDPYFINDGKYYNGGFVPIIGHAKTFKRIINEWESIHRHILSRNIEKHINWWAGMFSLQAVCERNSVQMVSCDFCFIPRANQLTENHYTCHYSIDTLFDKRTYPNIKTSMFPNNTPYNRIKEWFSGQ